MRIGAKVRGSKFEVARSEGRDVFLNRNKGGVKNFGLDGEYGKKGS